MLTCSILFNIASNLFRIAVLVLFNIPPGNLMHNIVGIVYLITYAVLPMMWYFKARYAKFAAPVKVAQSKAELISAIKNLKITKI